ncbi:SusC/RagA family TonB-linked outer membrane protein [Capnocytophaga felis]|uniref:SusC/RagA family TonB-linked outer membrane protein n=1 Tax=Capnocytophaga felis TaxID=2267611 RepID=A0A5M4B6J6_9FLAO|nr:TonB-dependent receptor [Capnocytophaga felis]GET45221.1 SusC/RagA family TonB-linked outer membrane protein [Capnocytophaga felis]GET47616.1 SusC/RagA family TonB-linked outer membrane protein [Capnocytophaga felis]
MFKQLFATFVLMLLALPLSAQVKVTGKVTDENNSPLPGASIVVKGTTSGVSSDFDGNYEIQAKQGDVLEVSFIGFQTQTKKVTGGGKSLIINFLLKEDAQQLDDVVVVGYGTQKKENLTGAVATVDAKVLSDRPITKLSEGLQGAVGNLNITTGTGGGEPNANKNINIRGYTGLGRTDGPLVVIDGVQGGDLNTINPNDVESISVVKDAAAAAVYGSSAPNGVIIIKTKQGRKGTKTTFSYSNNFGYAQPIGVPKMLNSLDFANFYNEAAANAGRSPLFTDEVIDRVKAYQAGTFPYETVKQPGENKWSEWMGANANNDWFKILLKDISLSSQHTMSVNGGTEATTYYVGIGVNKKDGLFRYGKDTFTRYNLRTNITTDATSWLTFGVRLAYARENFDRPNRGGNLTGNNWFHQIPRKFPTVPLYLPNGEYSQHSNIPYMENSRFEEIWDKPTLTGEIILKPFKGFSTTVNYTYTGSFGNNFNHWGTIYETLPDGQKRAMEHTSINSFSRYFERREDHTFNAFANYDFSLSKHDFKLLVGFVGERSSFLGASAANNNLYSDSFPSLSLTYGASPSISDEIRHLVSAGIFGRVNYSYDDRYLLEIVGRYDGSSKFLADSRWRFYPGFSAGWNVHRESFWPESDIVTSLKIRGSYGSLGDQSLSIYENNWYKRTYPFYPDLGTRSPSGSNYLFAGGREAYITLPGLVDPTLTWVTTNTIDFGFDASLFKNRLSVEFDWYRKNVKDYIGPAALLPNTLGTGVPQTNSVGFRTDGWELTLNWRDRIGEDFTYGAKFVLSDYQGIVTEYPNEKKFINTWYVGQKMGDIWGYETDRYFTDAADVATSPDQSKIRKNWGAGDIKYKDLNGDGKIDWGQNTLDDSGDKRVIGNNTPRYNYSLLLDGRYKNFDFSIFLQGVGKRDAWVGSNYFWGITGSEWQSSPFTIHLEDRWTPNTPDGYFPKFYMDGNMDKNTQVQTKYLQDASYLRIKNLQIGYSLPNEVIEKLKMSKFRLFIGVDNLYTYSPMKKHSVLDPELSINDAKIYPLQRTYSVGLNLEF